MYFFRIPILLSLLLSVGCVHSGKTVQNNTVWLVFRFAGQASKAHAGMLVAQVGSPLSVDDVLQQGMFFSTPQHLRELVAQQGASYNRLRSGEEKDLSPDAWSSNVFAPFDSVLLEQPDRDHNNSPRPSLNADWVYYVVRLIRGQSSGNAGILVPRDPRNSSGGIEYEWFFHYGQYVRDVYSLDTQFVLSTIQCARYDLSDERRPTRGLTESEITRFKWEYERQLQELTKER